MDQYKGFLSQQLLIGEALKSAAHLMPNQKAIVFENQSSTYQELLDRSRHLAGWLQTQGLQKEDKIACICKNNLAFIELYFASSLAGMVFVPLNFRLNPSEFIYILTNSDTKILFIEEEYLDMIMSIKPELAEIEQIIVIGNQENSQQSNTIFYDEIFDLPFVYMEDNRLKDDDPHVIVYTSGTTGKPKGAVLTHKNLYINGLNRIYENKTNKGKKSLVVTPLFHQAALSGISQLCLTNGTMYIHRDFQPQKVLDTIQKEQINTMFCAPTMWNMLVREAQENIYDLSSMDFCTLGSAITPVELKRSIMRTFPNAKIFEAFGQTEMSPSAIYLLPEDSLRKTESVGKPSVNIRVRIVDDEMNDVPIGTVGEIIYQGPTMMKEYYKNPEATAEAFRGGWFHSGDLVRMDDEGFIYVVDRKKDMIISGGENVYSAEVEEVLFNHADVLEAAVVGVPDEKWGETVKAFVVLKPAKMVSAEEIILYCQQHLASYKKPRIVEFVDTLPRNATGKVLKHVLRSY